MTPYGRSVRTILLSLLFVGLGLAMVGNVARAAPTGPGAGEAVAVAPDGAALLDATSPSATGSSLALGISVTPSAICAQESDECPAGTGVARVTMTASASEGAGLAYPAVQVAFVLETVTQDGTANWEDGDIAYDKCAIASPGSQQPACEESNGVPFFVANAGTIANAIQDENPHTKVSFALVDFFATYDDDWNDDDGAEYHVDISQFVAAQYFGAEVKATFQSTVLDGGWSYPDNDMSDNDLDSSSITALYGTIIGSGLSWENNTHHVIVYMGSAAPQDPNYAEDMCLGWQDGSATITGPACYAATCEPSYVFQNGIQPQCEGWVSSQDGNANDSIAALAHTSATCTDSVGGDCTIDVIDYNDCNTDPNCKDWATGRGPGSGPDGYAVVQDVDHILLAGCALAAATGGTWDGPEGFTCPDGQSGTILQVPHGLVSTPNTQNPYLLQALRSISFGPVLVTQVAKGTGKPVFTFMPFGSMALAPTLNATATCERQGVPFPSCQKVPTILTQDGRQYLGWNWSTNASTNVMYVGDSWQVSFNVIASGPPYQLVPVDACTTPACYSAGSGDENGVYTWATYVPGSNVSIAIESFPLAQIAIENVIPTTPILTPPPASPPPPPPPTVTIVTPIAQPQQVGVGQTVSVTNVSLQGIAAGVIAMGASRIRLRQRPVAVVAGKSGVVPSGSRFSAETGNPNPAFGRFE